MYVDKKQVMQALTILAIEKALLNIGKPVFDKVVNKLQKDFHCYLSDCYYHPEYLDSTLKSLFGNSSSTIVKSIKEELIENMDDDGICLLVQKIGA